METHNNSANLKLKLLINGLKLDDTVLTGLGTKFKEYQYGYNDSNWAKRQSREVIPSELVLPGEIVVASHLRPSSPYTIKRDGDIMLVIDDRTNKEISTIEYLSRPKIWDLKLSDGSSIKNYLNVYGKNCLNLFIVADCDFWNEGKPCVFCSLKPSQSLHNDVVVFKSVDKIAEAVNIAFTNDSSFKWMIVTGGSLKNRKEEVLRYYNVLSEIKKYIPSDWNGKIKGNAALLPTNNEEDLQMLFSTGIEHPSFNMEVWGKELFLKYCEGKEQYASFDNLIETYKKAVKIWGNGEVWCNFVGGISPISDLKVGFKYMADIGVVPGANIFHLDPSALAVKLGLTEPTEAYVYEMYSALVDIYKEYDYKPFFSESVLRNSLSNEMYNGWL